MHTGAVSVQPVGQVAVVDLISVHFSGETATVRILLQDVLMSFQDSKWKKTGRVPGVDVASVSCFCSFNPPPPPLSRI